MGTTTLRGYNSRGYFGIGVHCPKTESNVGTLWRSAYQLGASFVFTIEKRYKQQASDTLKTWKHIPLFHYDTFEDFYTHMPHDCQLIGIETGYTLITSFTHREREILLLGAEDHGLPNHIMWRCHALVTLPSINTDSYNVAVAGSLAMFHRYLTKAQGE